MCNAVADWYDRAFEDDQPLAPTRGAELIVDGTQDAVVACGGSEVHVGIAPDLSSARRLALNAGARGDES
jgi:hypothetical protein